MAKHSTRRRNRSRDKESKINKRKKRERSSSSSFYSESEESIVSSSSSSSSSSIKEKSKTRRNKKEKRRSKKKEEIKRKNSESDTVSIEKRSKSREIVNEINNIDIKSENKFEDDKSMEKAIDENDKTPVVERNEEKYEGIELRSRVIKEEENESNMQALEVYSSFKKVNYLEIPNVHRKLIIYNLPPDINEDEIKQYFLTLLNTLNPNIKLSNPIIKIDKIQVEYGVYYIFELATKDNIEILKEMNNTEWRGYRMKIEKPYLFFREFNSTQGKYVELKEIKKSLNFMSESDNKLYMGGIPPTAKESEIREIVESFGQLKTFNLVKDNNSEDDLNRGFCFFEYVDEKVTERAIKGLHNREIGEKRLKVQRANINNKSFSIAQQIKANPQQVPIREEGKSNFTESAVNIQPLPQIDIPIYASLPSRVLQFINIITPEDVIDDSDYREISEDIRAECMQFGTVLNVEIPRPDKTTFIASPAVGKIFVKFSTIPSAKKARYYLSGRKYNRRTLIASFYPENYFDVREFNYQG